jgi:peptidoglycan/xylan/chitin deacetylase (PgdA/CDA1 family)
VTPTPIPPSSPQPKIIKPLQVQEAAVPTAIPVGHSVKVPILYYHYIGNNPNPADKARDDLSVTPDKFDAQLGYLQHDGYTPIDLNTLFEAIRNQGTLPGKPIILTFDDGYIDFYVNAYPILRKYNFKAVVFIPTGLVDTGYYLKWEQIKEMAGSGIIEFEAHSITHPNLVALTADKAAFEIIESKRVLTEKLGKPVNFFAYPYGASTPQLWNIVKNDGFLAGFGTWPSAIQAEGYIYNLPRIRIAGGYSLEDYKSRIAQY